MLKILFVICFAGFVYQWVMRNKVEKKYEQLLNKSIRVNYLICETEEDHYEYVEPDRINIHNKNADFERELEENREVYVRLVNERIALKQLLDAGRTIDELKSDSVYGEMAKFHFDDNITGWEEDGILHIDQGRHRCEMAKELGVKIPIYLTGKYIVRKIKDCEFDWRNKGGLES